MADWCAARTRNEALAELERARIPCGPVNELDEVLVDPQVQARGLLRETPFAGSQRPVPLATTPMRLSRSPGEIRHAAPTLGQHTDEVLREAGYSETEIADLRGQSVV